MPYLILGLALLIGVLLAAKWYVNADPKALASVLKWVGGAGLAALFALLVVRGQLGYLLATGAALAPLVLRWRAIYQNIRNAAKTAQGPSQGQSSEISTRFLAMRLDHDTGLMTGHVREGAYKDRSLETLTQEETLDLLAQCRAEDAQSAQILEAYLDQMHGPDWRDAESGEPHRPAAGGPMTRQQALDILGLGPDPSPEDIREAHRRLMLVNHPDRGGSTYLAAQINLAKDMLLGGK